MTIHLITVLAPSICLGAAFLCLLLALRYSDPDSTPERLRKMGAPDPDEIDVQAHSPRNLEDIELAKPFVQRVIVPLLQQLLRIGGRLLPGANSDAIVLRLARAGAPPHVTVEVFLGLKVLAAVGCAVLALLLQITLPPLLPAPDPVMTSVWTLAGGVAGFFLPELWLRDGTKRRQKAVRKVLPDTLDVLSISVEAGLGFDAAINRICQKAQNPLTAEFEHYLTEIRLGKARREALRQIESRTGVEDLSTFISAIIQADQLGVSISKTLRIQSEQLRVKRRQRAEQLAQKAPLKMLFPMILFIFPSIFVVILGPAVRQLMHLG